ncbi:MAG TPA: site-2 protease family protein [Terracidiphilus sp.]|nr:site-2 protease family protein [Terracidiphilus sp.]
MFGQGSFRLFRVKGIDVYLNWTWFLVAVFEIQARQRHYTSPVWNVLEYLALFGIVLLHEFGHAFACRSVGGTADTIMLWPLGGVAYVRPPQRPGATLWSIAAGPLVNVALLPVLGGAFALARSAQWRYTMPNEYRFLGAILTTDIVLLVFNILPIYPLDGGQILRSLLWFPLGRARSLMVASVLGFLGVAGLVLLALWLQSFWTGLIAAYAGINCWNGFKTAQALRKLEKIPRRQGFACPSCHTSPPVGSFWRCNNCSAQFDTFQTGGVCPQCSARFEKTTCMDCHQQSPIQEWQPGYVPGVGVMGGVRA